jgi:hypothetical protein
VSVPDVVTGDPEIVNSPLGAAIATLVTVPELDGGELTHTDPLEVNTLPEDPGDVSPVPPLVTGRAVPDKLSVNVPAVVTGDPLTVKKAGAARPTDVTVPLPPPPPPDPPKPEYFPYVLMLIPDTFVSYKAIASARSRSCPAYSQIFSSAKVYI